MGRIGSGTRDFLSGAIETQKGVPVPRGSLYPIKSDTLNTTFNVLRADAQTGDRLTEVIIDILKGKVAGGLTTSLFAGVGMDLLVNNLGNAIRTTAVTTAVTTADGVTANGQTVHTLASVTGYRKGQLIPVGDAPFQELVQVVDLDTTAHTLTTKRVKAAFPLTAGYAISAPAQHVILPRQTTDTFAWDNPTHTLEANRGFQYAWVYPGVRNLKSEIRAGNADVEVVHTVMGTEDPFQLGPGSFTMPSWSQQQRRDVRRPMTIRRGYAILPNAQAGEAAGTMTTNRLVGLQSWSLDWDNFGIDKQFWDGDERSVMDSYVTRQKGTVKYVYANASGRNAIFDEYLWNPNASPVPFYLTLVRNRGTVQVPDWIGVGVYIPAMKVTVGTETWPGNDVGTVSVEADITMPDDGSPPIQIFCINDTATAYLASGTLHP